MPSIREKINSIENMTDPGCENKPQIEPIDSRDRVIVRTSVIGIIANVFLALFKAVIGLMSNSIAIVLDAVNNISDAGSSVITIIGTKLAGKEPDRKHPFGYGRIEYMSAMVIAIIILYAGITSFTESVKKILHPETAEYTTISLVIVFVGVLVKIVLGRYVKGVGEKVHSDSLVNSGADATLDSVISASTLVAAILYMFAGISLEAWLGAIISIVIIKSGVEMLKDTISQLLGERADLELAQAIKSTIKSFPEVQGAYDLVLNNYGPDVYNGSAHIEVPDTFSADQLDQLLRRITLKVYAEHNVILTAIGVYSVNTRDAKSIEARNEIGRIIKTIPHVLQMHGFYLDEEAKAIRFDVVISFDSKDREKTHQDVIDAVQKAYPEYSLSVAMDIDFSET